MSTGRVLFLFGVIACLGGAVKTKAADIISNPVKRGTVANAFPNFAEELGVSQNEWQRSKEIYSERLSTGIFSPRKVAVAAYQSAGTYYFFKNRILVAIREKRLSPKHIARINEQEILSGYFDRPPLGIKESDWRRVFPDSNALALGNSEGVPINAYERGGTYYYFRQGVLIRRAPAM